MSIFSKSRILFEVTDPIFDPVGDTADLDFYIYDQFFRPEYLTDDGKAFMRENNTAGTIDVYFIDQVLGEDAAGFTLPDDFITFLGRDTPQEIPQYLLDFSDKVFILDSRITSAISNPHNSFNNFSDTNHVVAHEVLHTLGILTHSADPTNIMHDEMLPLEEDVTDMRRLTKAQEEKIFEVDRITISKQNQ